MSTHTVHPPLAGNRERAQSLQLCLTLSHPVDCSPTRLLMSTGLSSQEGWRGLPCKDRVLMRNRKGDRQRHRRNQADTEAETGGRREGPSILKMHPSERSPGKRLVTVCSYFPASLLRNKSTKRCVTSSSLKAQRRVCQSSDQSNPYTLSDPFYSVPDSQTKRHALLASLKSHQVPGPFWTMDLVARNAHTPSP